MENGTAKLFDSIWKAIDKPQKRHKAPEGECITCDRERAAGNNFHSSHDASDRCESGKRNHCSCDVCF